MKTVPVAMETVDIGTGKTVKRETAAFHIMPPKPGMCAVCAIDHTPDLPHNAQSLYYQYQFYGEHNRWPTWGDAVAHCSPGMQKKWKQLLKTNWTEPEGDVKPIAQPYSVTLATVGL